MNECIHIHDTILFLLLLCTANRSLQQHPSQAEHLSATLYALIPRQTLLMNTLYLLKNICPNFIPSTSTSQAQKPDVFSGLTALAQHGINDCT